jgi:hypothetical protein
MTIERFFTVESTAAQFLCSDWQGRRHGLSSDGHTEREAGTMSASQFSSGQAAIYGLTSEMSCFLTTKTCLLAPEQVSRQQVGVLLLMFKAQRQVQLRRDVVELA